ncbi:MAG: prolyl oligopeptidase family serine peptidase [Alphaproteobacteria bacterium]|nr:prolyl oligopeptidase family serine peptidase [Alphaproteobacteria bacterium]
MPHRATGLAALVLALLLAAAPARASEPACTDADLTAWARGGSLCLAVATYPAPGRTTAPALVAFLHGDVSRGGPADYLARAARRFAEAGGDLVAVALYRPGYEDAAGRRSEGSHNGRRDHYTPATIDAIGDALAALKAFHKARKLVVVGHSGGAATAGVLIGRKPGLIDAAVLLSCPCDVPRWRREGGRGEWRASLSPHDVAGAVPAGTTVVALTGTADDNTAPSLARDYVAALAARGVPATFRAVPGAGHNTGEGLWEDGRVAAEIARLAAR